MYINMDYDEFVHQVCSKVKDKIGMDYIVYPYEIVKQNDVVLQAIMISERDKQSKTMPVIYLEQYYERYKETKDLDECAEAIINFYKGLVKKDIDVGVTSGELNSLNDMWGMENNFKYIIQSIIYLKFKLK